MVICDITLFFVCTQCNFKKKCFFSLYFVRKHNVSYDISYVRSFVLKIKFYIFLILKNDG